MIDFTKSTEQEREILLGREFRNICVIKSDGHSETHIVMNGESFCLLGSPVDCLMVFMAGIDKHKNTIGA